MVWIKNIAWYLFPFDRYLQRQPIPPRFQIFSSPLRNVLRHHGHSAILYCASTDISARPKKEICCSFLCPWIHQFICCSQKFSLWLLRREERERRSFFFRRCNRLHEKFGISQNLFDDKVKYNASNKKFIL